MKKLKYIVSSALLASSVLPIMTSCSQAKTESFMNSDINTIISACNDAITFAKTFCQYSGNNKQEAISVIRNWIMTEENIAKVTITRSDYTVDAHIRLLDVNHDIWADTSITKDCFTFEFIDVIAFSCYNSAPNNNYFDSEKQEESDIYWMCQNFIYWMLPKELSNNVKPVIKASTLFFEEGTTPTPIFGMERSSNYFFPLSTSEYNLHNNTREGEPYWYYKYIDKTQSATDCYIKYYMGTYSKDVYPETGVAYWTRSNPGSYISVASDINGFGVESSPICPEYFGLAPAFCI